MNQILFDESECLLELQHYLPNQAPLKDFIHHNTLHAFQQDKFHEAIHKASQIFGYSTYLSLDAYRQAYFSGRITDLALEYAIHNRPVSKYNLNKESLINQTFDQTLSPRIGKIRQIWKSVYQMNMDKQTHPVLFRLLSNYLDQGISVQHFPVDEQGFLATLRLLERHSYISLFKSERTRLLFNNSDPDIAYLLSLLVGDPKLYKSYLFDQQFAHPGWSGMVSVLEQQAESLYAKRLIRLKELIQFELLLEIDALDVKNGHHWLPISEQVPNLQDDLFEPVASTPLSEALAIWQDAYEWSYYNEVLAGISENSQQESSEVKSGFKAIFCIDDRSCSFRRHLEMLDNDIETFGTPGHFNVAFYFQPQNGQFYTKVCPAPMSPNHIIKESNDMSTNEKDMHFNKNSHSLFFGWLISQSLGFWSAIKLALSVFKPSMSPATSYSFRHMNKLSELTIENIDNQKTIEGYQIGFKLEEMAIRVENLLKSIGLVKDFSPIIYTIGHGSTSVNNTHYAGYDCGACSGRPGSVNARVISYMCNHVQVRKILRQRGIDIPSSTQFVGGLRDTSRDTIVFYDVEKLSNENKQFHIENEKKFFKASDYNAKERSRRFDSINSKLSVEKIHEKVKIRSVSLFEPRPELNHATNSLCIVGSRKLTKHLFLDRRAFMNSYDYNIDPDGHYLTGILNAVAPVCGGINLEYYFSRVDNNKYGAGTKLAHNVMGLIGVANGIDGDLRPGLPSQMIELHDPVRLLVIVEHYPEVVAQVIQKNQNTFQWFSNHWINLVVLDPIKKEFFKFDKNQFIPFQIIETTIDSITEINDVITTTSDNIDVKILNYSNHE